MTPCCAPWTRRSLLHSSARLGASFWASSALWPLDNALALPLKRMEFPRDHGAHTDFQTEWWYVTGYANADGVDAAYGFQVTFFRSRVPQTQGMQSALAAKQLLFAHAAITDVRGKKLWHDQRIARWSGASADDPTVGTAHASTQGTAITLQDWSLKRDAQGLNANSAAKVSAQIRANNFALDLQLLPTQPVLLQGKQGLSRKGPDAAQASYYYSQPQLQVQGIITLQGKRHSVSAGSTAWLDHEWSQALLHPDAVGWDWIGINLLDGSALTAFRLRTQAGQALWSGGSYRSAPSSSSQTPQVFEHGDVQFTPVRTWRSPASQATYPVEWRVRITHRSKSGSLDTSYTIKAVIDNQELDSRQSTGAVYWEGLCKVWEGKRLVGRGYLEMTGYAGALKL
jgi:predicted secreted hydrolase